MCSKLRHTMFLDSRGLLESNPTLFTKKKKEEEEWV